MRAQIFQPFSGKQRGLTLVELMVSMLLGILLSGGMISAYLAAKRTHYYDDEIGRIQENGRYAMRLVSRELSMAGFLGGLPVLSSIPPATVAGDCALSAWALDTAEPIEMVNDHAGTTGVVTLHDTALTCLDGASIAPGTDIFTIKRTAAGASLRRGVPASGLTLSTTEQWYLRVASGRDPQWERLRPAALLEPGLAQPSLSYWEVVSRIFFIRRYSQSTGPSDELPSLCMKTLAGNQMTSRCLVEGVEDMQIEFGIDTSGDGVPNQYKSEPVGNEFKQAVSARIYLLMRSIHAITGYRDEKSYTLGGTHRAARHDPYLRRVFSSTVRLRNRIEPVG